MAHDDPHRFADIHEELHRHLPSEPALRVKALESLLVEKGMLDPKAVDAWIAVYTEEIGPKRGATLVAKAWLDPAFKQRLLGDGARVIVELGFYGRATLPRRDQAVAPLRSDEGPLFAEPWQAEVLRHCRCAAAARPVHCRRLGLGSRRRPCRGRPPWRA
jgi:hypothetical protein